MVKCVAILMVVCSCHAAHTCLFVLAFQPLDSFEVECSLFIEGGLGAINGAYVGFVDATFLA